MCKKIKSVLFNHVFLTVRASSSSSTCFTRSEKSDRDWKKQFFLPSSPFYVYPLAWSGWLVGLFLHISRKSVRPSVWFLPRMRRCNSCREEGDEENFLMEKWPRPAVIIFACFKNSSEDFGQITL